MEFQNANFRLILYLCSSPLFVLPYLVRSMCQNGTALALKPKRIVSDIGSNPSTPNRFRTKVHLLSYFFHYNYSKAIPLQNICTLLLFVTFLRLYIVTTRSDVCLKEIVAVPVTCGLLFSKGKQIAIMFQVTNFRYKTNNKVISEPVAQ